LNRPNGENRSKRYRHTAITWKGKILKSFNRFSGD
jgi:hypothetical protein